MKPKTILYELNEVPWEVIDKYVRDRPNSTLAKLLPESLQLTSYTKDEGELHPWSTWPTVHRGVYNFVHNLRFINQEDKSCSYPPIWEILSENKIDVGVFGSLQSWPVPKNCQSYSFYVPDTFAKDEKTHPSYMSYFQAFNLTQTKRDGAVAQTVQLKANLLPQVVKLLKTGLSLKTCFKLAKHLASERKNPLYKTVRSTHQATISFDFYKKLLKENKPQFSTYFTNHAAGIMHRYWKYYFPEDFNYQLIDKRDSFLSKNIIRAMDIADKQISYLYKYAKKNNYTLIILSSMGQEAVDRGEYHGEFRLNNLDKFTKFIGFKKQVKQNLAMQPDFALEFDSQMEMNEFIKLAKMIQDKDKQPIMSFKVSGKSLNLSLNLAVVGQEVIKENKFYLSNGSSVDPSELGINMIHRDVGTGYHQPKGIIMAVGDAIKANNSRKEVESIQIAPTLLKLYGINAPDYMAEPIGDVFEVYS
ncbi:hypothetical protein L3V82_00815 [Thiotrichales bacterium 19S3-7]|nr:hypothetical protein [Thiotrichales bacterium 19S3-7]MCF6800704.1 hypothetical protein [Thiotrichales bacterium 19S3-11]